MDSFICYVVPLFSPSIILFTGLLISGRLEEAPLTGLLIYVPFLLFIRQPFNAYVGLLFLPIAAYALLKNRSRYKLELDYLQIISIILLIYLMLFKPIVASWTNPDDRIHYHEIKSFYKDPISMTLYLRYTPLFYIFGAVIRSLTPSPLWMISLRLLLVIIIFINFGLLRDLSLKTGADWRITSASYLVIGAPFIALFSTGTYPNVMMDYLVLLSFKKLLEGEKRSAYLIALLLPALHITSLLYLYFLLMTSINSSESRMAKYLIPPTVTSLAFLVLYLKMPDYISLYLANGFSPENLLHFPVMYIHSLKAIGIVALLSILSRDLRKNPIIILMVLNMAVAYLFSLSMLGVAWRILQAYSYLYGWSFSLLKNKLGIKSYVATVVIALSISSIFFASMDAYQYKFIDIICSHNCMAMVYERLYHNFIEVVGCAGELISGVPGR